MKLSEAILLGSVGSEQGFGPPSILTSYPRKCALGAALLAAGIECNHEMGGFTLVTNQWPWSRQIHRPPTKIGLGLRFTDAVYDIIWRLNDIAKWTRPQIAAWVASIEPQEPATSEVPIASEAICHNASLSTKS